MAFPFLLWDKPNPTNVKVDSKTVKQTSSSGTSMETLRGTSRGTSSGTSWWTLRQGHPGGCLESRLLEFILYRTCMRFPKWLGLWNELELDNIFALIQWILQWFWFDITGWIIMSPLWLCGMRAWKCCAFDFDFECISIEQIHNSIKFQIIGWPE